MTRPAFGGNDGDRDRDREGAAPGRFSRIAMSALWPAFLMAGVLEGLVFVVVDPADLRWFGSEPLGWSPQAVYTVTFFIFWAVISTATAITALLLGNDDSASASSPG